MSLLNLQIQGVTSFNASAAAFCLGIYYGFNKIPQPFHAKQAQDGLNIGNFFLQTDLHPGTKMVLQFPQTTNEAMFLPRQVADSIPFSSKKLPEILNRLSVKEKSAEAELMKKEIEECEEPAMDGESRFCATSLESLIDFSTSKLGRNVNVLTNEVRMGSQEFEFGVRMKKVADKSVVCHKMNYPYAVFYCHTFTKTRTYMIPLAGADGSKSKAMAACHSDTSAWHPQHVPSKCSKLSQERSQSAISFTTMPWSGFQSKNQPQASSPIALSVPKAISQYFFLLIPII